MKQLIFGTVNIEMENKLGNYWVTLTDNINNVVELSDLSTQAASLLNTAIRNLNSLAREHEIATILVFDDEEGIDVVPDLIETKGATEPGTEIYDVIDEDEDE